MRFNTASEAVAFAEEILNRPVVKGNFEVILRQPGKGEDVFSLRDMAHTISERLAQIEQDELPASGKVYRYLFGKGDNVQLERAVSDFTDEMILRGVNVRVDGKMLDRGFTERLVMAVLLQTRLNNQGRASKSYSWLSRFLQIDNVQQFRRKNKDVVIKLRAEIEQSVEMVDHRMGNWLGGLDLIV